MENISLLSDFMGDPVNQNYYNRIERSEVPEDYTLHTGGNFIFISNNRNRTVRFSAGKGKKSQISSTDIEEWMKKIKTLYPGF